MEDNHIFFYRCRDCGWSVGSYRPCEELFKHRPSARGWDNWLACDNGNCKNAKGKGNCCDFPPWVEMVFTL